jgi:SAM-dependent methyltransferase
MKDFFSKEAAGYARFRPHYPVDVLVNLLSLVPVKGRALDLATGNGQFAAMLAPHFDRVDATDASAQQLSLAAQVPGLYYQVGAAEQIDFPDASFDLVTVAQGLHWFHFEDFYPELKRVLKPDGVFAAVGYGLVQIGDDLQPILNHFYDAVIGPFWAPQRRHLDEGLQSVPFPLQEIPMESPPMCFAWDVEAFLGYLGTWSGVFHFRKRMGFDPIDEIAPLLRAQWGDVRRICFPLFFRVGVIHSN